MTEKPQVDFEEVVKASGMPVTESEVHDRFNAIADEEGSRSWGQQSILAARVSTP